MTGLCCPVMAHFSACGGRGNPFCQHAVSAADLVVPDGVAQCAAASDQNNGTSGPGYAGVDQVPLEHDEMAVEHRNDHYRVFCPLGFVNGGGIGKDDFIQFGDVITDRPSVINNREGSVFQADGRSPL